MRKTAASLMCSVALLAVAQASAQVYKWVDDKGATHYSDKAPEKGAPAKRAEIVPDKLSVYSTNAFPVPVSYSKTDPILNGRIEALERQLRAERESRESIAAAQAQAALAAYERCLADRRIDCDEYGGLYPPYGWGSSVAVSRAHYRRVSAPRSSPLTGITAGNVVAQAQKVTAQRSGSSSRPLWR